MFKSVAAAKFERIVSAFRPKRGIRGVHEAARAVDAVVAKLYRCAIETMERESLTEEQKKDLVRDYMFAGAGCESTVLLESGRQRRAAMMRLFAKWKKEREKKENAMKNHDNRRKTQT